MRKSKTDTAEKKYDDTPAFREWQRAVRNVSFQKGRVAEGEAEVIESKERLERAEEDAAYWQKIVEAENGTTN